MKSTLRKANIVVSAQQSLWFAWAVDLHTNPGPFEESDASIPASDPVENGASQVMITADSNGRWRHDPSPDRQSDANGLEDERGLEDARYQSATYNSEHIIPLTAKLNLLVAMWEFDNGPPASSADAVWQHPIGLAGMLSVPTGATRLFIGFHDGREWTNNSGSVNVTLEWIN